MSFSQIHYIHFDEIPSTSGWARAHINEFDPTALTCITAAKQPEGRARGGKQWLSPPGDNLYLTLFFTLPPAPFLLNLAQMSALCLAELLLEQGCPIELKWPNDLLVHGKKLAGILVETSPYQDRVAVCIGVGLNIEAAPSGTDQPVTFVDATATEKRTSQQTTRLFVQQFREGLSLLEARGFAPMQPRYNELLLWKGEWVLYTDGEHEVEGICRGVDLAGRLLLELPSEETLFLTSGSLRKLE